MGPAYHKGVPSLGVPENPTDYGFLSSLGILKSHVC